MAQISKFAVRNGFNSVLLLVSAATLAACGSASHKEPEVTSVTKPTITFSYTDDRSLIEATRKAEDYCAQHNAWPRTESFFNRPEGGRNVTFICDQPRTAALVAPSSAAVVSQPATATGAAVPASPPAVSYSFRDDRGLVEASNMAARYCMNYSAQARSTLVKNNNDGSKTITFDCVKTM